MSLFDKNNEIIWHFSNDKLFIDLLTSFIYSLKSLSNQRKAEYIFEFREYRDLVEDEILGCDYCSYNCQLANRTMRRLINGKLK
jgi:hypothetical protein